MLPVFMCSCCGLPRGPLVPVPPHDGWSGSYLCLHWADVGIWAPPQTGQLQVSPSPCPHIIPWEACVCVFPSLDWDKRLFSPEHVSLS